MKEIKIIDSYTVTGIPFSSLPRLCKELNINEEGLHEYLQGQTMGLVGGEGLVYPHDIIRYLRRLPVSMEIDTCAFVKRLE